MGRRKIVIVTGLSGSGKSTVARTLEDLGYFCVDNLPVDLAPKLIELMDAGGTELEKVALIIDLRQRKFLSSVFLDTRFSATQGHVSGNFVPGRQR